ncbi:hypothetical protein MPSEU_000507900 [Mayamaea pseudoterrestris]|nr:hypothetical protein MPSEU_000507900 [Mayamaea pseudoterrestris]
MHPMKQQECCRIVLLGAAKARIVKVYSLIQDDPLSTAYAHRGVAIQFLPCVASFDSYLEEDGKRIRYLTKVEYFRNGVELVPDGLLPFVDDDASSAPFDSETAASPLHDTRDKPLFQGVSGVAIGAGISAAEDAEKIQVFIETLSRKKVSIAVVQPNSEYASMQEELEAYRTFDVAEKEEAMKHGTIGPAKMAQFAIQFACDIVDKAIEQAEEQRRKQAQQLATEAEAAAPPTHVPATVPTDMNVELNRYACRKCRTMLFGSDHVEDPPHLPAKHKFSHRKQHANAADACQSLFLTSNVNWLAASDMGEEVGKLSCPRCMVKVGTWHWSGAQCSCGTWVVPAIQVPVSKVDLVLPPVRRDDPLPLSAVAIIQPAITDKQNVST